MRDSIQRQECRVSWKIPKNVVIYFAKVYSRLDGFASPLSCSWMRLKTYPRLSGFACPLLCRRMRLKTRGLMIGPNRTVGFNGVALIFFGVAQSVTSPINCSFVANVEQHIECPYTYAFQEPPRWILRADIINNQLRNVPFFTRPSFCSIILPPFFLNHFAVWVRSISNFDPHFNIVFVETIRCQCNEWMDVWRRCLVWPFL